MILYRGLRKIKPAGIHQNEYLEKPRSPRNSHPQTHLFADEWFFSRFGVRARSECIFCTPCLKTANTYISGIGKVVIISTNDEIFSLIYSEKVEDFSEIDHDLEDSTNQEKITQWLQDKNYIKTKETNDIPKDFKGEIMLHCSSYKIEYIN